jgi:hypothetical protein
MTLKLSSPAFEQEGEIPKLYTATAAIFLLN